MSLGCMEQGNVGSMFAKIAVCMAGSFSGSISKIFCSRSFGEQVSLQGTSKCWFLEVFFTTWATGVRKEMFVI